MPVVSSAATRTGVFISHAHEDRQLAECLRKLLERTLGPDPAPITCTSDHDRKHGLAPGGELDQQIRARLDATRVFILLATHAASQSTWVHFECGHADAASRRDEVQFYVVVPSDALGAHVPEPYQGKVRVELSDGVAVHQFAADMRPLLKSGPVPVDDHYIGALLELEHCSSLLEKSRIATDRQHLLTMVAGLETSRTQHEGALKQERRKVLAVAALVMAAFAAGATLYTAYTLDETRRLLDDEMKTRLSQQAAASDRARIQELKTLFPLSGYFVGDGSQKLPCSTVTAFVSDGNGGAERPVERDCDDGGDFTFSGNDLQADPLQPITLAARIRDKIHRQPFDRKTAPVAIHMRNVQ